MARMLILLLSLVSLNLLISCSAVQTLGALAGAASGGGIGVQVGKENTRALAVSQRPVGRDVNTGSVSSENVENINVQNDPSLLFMLLLILGWLLPSPGEMFNRIFRRKDGR